MIGIIISGHGNFASGLESSLKLISGEFSNMCFIDFLETYSTDDLKEKYKLALSQLKDCNDILALTDLVGGSPFKTLVELSIKSKQNINVIGGINLPMVIEATMSKDIISNLDDLVNTILNIGKENIIKFEMLDIKQDEYEDGI